MSSSNCCLLRNLYAGQEVPVRTRHGTTDWFQIGKGVRQCSILSPCLFNLHAEYIMRNGGLEEAQAGIKIARKNINNFKYADNISLMAESEEELKSLLMKVKEESEKAVLKLNFIFIYLFQASLYQGPCCSIREQEQSIVSLVKASNLKMFHIYFSTHNSLSSLDCQTIKLRQELSKQPSCLVWSGHS